uniref:Uncharacterized protein n=1 Tax=Anguilla anguilla TaxID=7936 RepID=A0A0E9RKG8_ANGAN
MTNNNRVGSSPAVIFTPGPSGQQVLLISVSALI